MKCRQITSGEVATPTCGQSICCFYCDRKDSCEEACGDAKDGVAQKCQDAFSEENALLTMKKDAAAVIKAIADLTIQKKKLEEKEKEMRAQLVKAMEQYGVKKFESDSVTFTYTAPTVRNSIDSVKLKKELPDVAAKYTKTSNVSASVKIEVK